MDYRSTTTVSNLKSRQEAIDWVEVQRLAKTHSGRKIATIFGIPSKTMSRWLLARNIKTNYGTKVHDVSEIAAMYRDGMTTIAIAEAIGASQSRIAQRLRHAGVVMRPSGQNLGKKMPPSAGIKISAARKGRYTGASNPNWRGGKGPKDQKERTSFKHKEWSRAVRARDNHVCTQCGVTGVKLHAHHVKSWKHHPDFRYDVDNGLTVCEPCHQALHKFKFHWLNGENGTSAEQAEA